MTNTFAVLFLPWHQVVAAFGDCAGAMPDMLSGADRRAYPEMDLHPEASLREKGGANRSGNVVTAHGSEVGDHYPPVSLVSRGREMRV